jgi:uncharacterized surface protein with fasciclin (FAS1) repeats
MNKRIFAVALALALFGAAPAFAQSAMSTSAMKANPMVGGAPMPASKTIVANAVNSKDHTTLVSLVKKAGLVETLSGPGPFTVFAPTNEAFAKLPSATLTAVGNDKATLTKVLTYHVVAGKSAWSRLHRSKMDPAPAGSIGILTVWSDASGAVRFRHGPSVDFADPKLVRPPSAYE